MKKRTNAAPTIYDVAAAAGVSHQTVSRFLSGYEGIRPATREKVQAALDELGYHRNSAARALRLSRSNRIGVIAHDLEETGPARIIKGAFNEAQRQGFVLDIILIDEQNAESIDEGISLAFEQRVDGVLALAQSDAVVQRLIERLPHVMVGGEVETDAENVPANERSGRLAADHLLELGHEAIGYISGPSGWDASRSRRRGFEDRLAEQGITPMWVHEGDWSARSGYDTWHALSARERDVTAIATANDSTAIGLIAAITESGRRVPDDISVVGTDDIAEARYQVPALTTIQMDHEGQGAVSVASLIARLEDGPIADQARFTPPSLIVRGSTQSVR